MYRRTSVGSTNFADEVRSEEVLPSPATFSDPLGWLEGVACARDGSMRIVAVGDSTTAGTPGFSSPLESPPAGSGNPESQYAYWMMRLHPDWEVLNRGVNGEDSGEILVRFPRDVVRERPDVVVILAGVNDVYRGRSAASVEANLSAMYAHARAAEIRIVAASILPYNSLSRRQSQTLHELNLWIESAAQESGFRFCDTHALVAAPNDPNRLAGSPDGLHPDVEGYRRMGEGLARVIEGFAMG
jgi:lysophospholipase L1-like esterase